MNTQLTLLRLSAGLILLLSALIAGALARSIWLILPLTLIFTLAYMLGRWQAWRHAIAAETISRVLSQLFATCLIQAVLVAILYLIGRGAGAVLGRTQATPLVGFDIFYCAVVAVLGLGLGAIVAMREPIRRSQKEEVAPVSSDAIEILPEPVTPQHFYRGIHYSHGSYTGPNHSFVGNSELSAGSDAKIDAAESRLKLRLPERLKALYRLQNGGAVHKLCTLKAGVSQPRMFDDLIRPFAGYDDLLPTEKLRTLREAVTEFSDGDGDSEYELLPEASSHMLILAQYYRHTLFLDYSNGAEPSNGPSNEPRVGCVDFDDFSNWKPHCVWWESFDALFAALRRYETLY